MIEFKIYTHTSELPDEWDKLPVNDVFLRRSFLTALQASSPQNISQYYLGVFKDQKLIGIAIIQRVEMYLDDVFRNKKNSQLKQLSKQLISKIVRGNALVVGNLMHTGQHGLFFLEEEIQQHDFLEIIYKAIEELTRYIKTKFNKKVRIIVFKDYFENDAISKSDQFFKAKKLFKAQVQPNMIFQVRDTWKTPKDYTAAFNKKYRRRYRTAVNKLSPISKEELNLEAIKNHSEDLYELYLNVSNNARVNSFKLHKNHFVALKEDLKSQFKVFGYFLNHKLVGFYTLILNNDKLETYFLGYDEELQHKHQMYLNMLFDMAFFGIENQFKTIVYARTAMEIKSSIGAKPYNMYIYLKHTNHFLANTILKFIVKYMNPIKTWEERHPFS